MPALTRPDATSAFPDRVATLALQASLLDGEPAMAAWRDLAAAGAEGEPGIASIMPLLLENLSRLAPEDPYVLKNPHTLTLFKLKGQAVTRFAEETLSLLEGVSIPTLALKGLALGASVYPSPGLRVVSDLDILIPETDFFRAQAVLMEAGFRASAGGPAHPVDLRANHAHPFFPSRPHQPSVDLHWHALASARGVDDDAVFWSGARPLMVGSVSTLSMCAEHQLLHVLVHGVRWTRVPHVRWVADAALILRANRTTFKAERLLSAAERFDVVAPIREGLRFVCETLGEGKELLEGLERTKRSWLADRAFKARSTAYEQRTTADRIALRVESAVWSLRSRRRTARKRRGTENN
jgi:hypothetical protein